MSNFDLDHPVQEATLELQSDCINTTSAEGLISEKLRNVDSDLLRSLVEIFTGSKENGWRNVFWRKAL